MKVLSRFLKKNQAQRDKKRPEQPDTANIPDLEKEEYADREEINREKF